MNFLSKKVDCSKPIIRTHPKLLFVWLSLGHGQWKRFLELQVPAPSWRLIILLQS